MGTLPSHSAQSVLTAPLDLNLSHRATLYTASQKSPVVDCPFIHTPWIATLPPQAAQKLTQTQILLPDNLSILVLERNFLFKVKSKNRILLIVKKFYISLTTRPPSNILSPYHDCYRPRVHRGWGLGHGVRRPVLMSSWLFSAGTTEPI